MNVKYYDLFPTVIKNRDDKENVNSRYEDNEVDYIKFMNFNVPSQYIGRKNNIEVFN